MPWFRVDEGFPEHPKVLRAGGDAAWLHVCAMAYTARSLTDGFIPAAMLNRLSDRRNPAKLAATLVEVGLWETSDGGWLIHDWHEYQPSVAEVEDHREERSRSGSFGNHRRWHLDRGISEPSCPFCASQGDRSAIGPAIAERIAERSHDCRRP
jgi:hypothetical protein